jgi:5-azacytidine-induced protein 1
LEARHATSCQRQQAEYEAALARHLAFVDKLLGDKDKLAAKCAQMAADVKAAESKVRSRAMKGKEKEH